MHQAAQVDTPASVTVPNNMFGLVLWAVARFGGGLIIAGASFYALTKVYADHQVQNERLMTIIETRAKMDGELSAALQTFRTSVESMNATMNSLAQDAREAHNLPRRTEKTQPSTK